MGWMLMPLRRYADFSGRSRRMEYWMFVLGEMILGGIIGVVTILLAAATQGSGQGSGAAAPVWLLLGLVVFVVSLGLLIPALAVQVRRLHDQDMSGWSILIAFVPFVGGIALLVLMFIEGTKGPNRFGPDPKGPPVAVGY